MLKIITAVASAVTLLVPAMEPANASPNQTVFIARLTCSNKGPIVINPEEDGRT